MEWKTKVGALVAGMVVCALAVGCAAASSDASNGGDSDDSTREPSSETVEDPEGDEYTISFGSVLANESSLSSESARVTVEGIDKVGLSDRQQAEAKKLLVEMVTADLDYTGQERATLTAEAGATGDGFKTVVLTEKESGAVWEVYAGESVKVSKTIDKKPTEYPSRDAESSSAASSSSSKAAESSESKGADSGSAGKAENSDKKKTKSEYVPQEPSEEEVLKQDRHSEYNSTETAFDVEDAVALSDKATAATLIGKDIAARLHDDVNGYFSPTGLSVGDPVNIMIAKKGVEDSGGIVSFTIMCYMGNDRVILLAKYDKQTLDYGFTWLP